MVEWEGGDQGPVTNGLSVRDFEITQISKQISDFSLISF